MKIEHLEIIDSTSEYMKRKKNREEYEVVYADEQTGGKGRRGNKWISNKGSGLFTYIVKNKNYEEKISLFVGYITYKVISKIVDNKNLKFKWPNDIYYNNKKLSGILVEKIDEDIIIGIGLNINNTDFGIFNENAVSLSIVAGKNYDIKEIITDIVRETEIEIKNINENWNSIVSFLNENHLLNEKKVENNLKETYYVKEINQNGSLKILKTGETEYKNIYSDEIKGIKILNPQI